MKSTIFAIALALLTGATLQAQCDSKSGAGCPVTGKAAKVCPDGSCPVTGKKSGSCSKGSCTKGACPVTGRKMARATITTGGLVALRNARVPFTLIDARKDAKGAIPGATLQSSLCYTCPTTMAKAVGSKDRLVVTYCSGPKCTASAKAAAQLRKAGYTNVIEYHEGIAGWNRYQQKCLASRQAKDCGKGSCGRDAAKGCGGCTMAKPTAKAGHENAAISSPGLQALVKAKVPFRFVDARSKRAKDDRGIPGSTVVTEAAFANQSRALPANKSSLLVAYCSNARCGASKKVAARLRQAGYTNVIVYSDGMEGWNRLHRQAMPAAATKGAMEDSRSAATSRKQASKGSCCGTCGGGCSSKK